MTSGKKNRLTSLFLPDGHLVRAPPSSLRPLTPRSVPRPRLRSPSRARNFPISTPITSPLWYGERRLNWSIDFGACGWHGARTRRRQYHTANKDGASQESSTSTAAVVAVEGRGTWHREPRPTGRDAYKTECALRQRQYCATRSTSLRNERRPQRPRRAQKTDRKVALGKPSSAFEVSSSNWQWDERGVSVRDCDPSITARDCRDCSVETFTFCSGHDEKIYDVDLFDSGKNQFKCNFYRVN